MQACWNHTAWILCHNDTILLEASPQRPMIYVGVGQESIEMYRGNFKIEDYLSQRVPLRVTGAEETDSGWTLDLEGRLRVQVVIQGEIAELSFEQLDPAINRFWLRVCADAEESCYGCGEQMSYLNLRDRHFPLWTSEPGVGRDKTTYITWRSDVENKAGGDYYNTNYPQPTYVSSRKYYLHADCTAYADFDFRNEVFHELQFWAVPNRIRIEAADNWENLLYRLSEFFGRQPLLPDWIYNGVILGVQGGTERAFSIAERTLQSGVPLAGIWCQDWAGKRETSFGRRLQWDWKLNEKMYPGLPEKIREYKEHGIRFLAYNNGYLVNDGELYREAKEKGYFALAADGGDYLVDFGEFYCGVVDLTNPEAFEWYKDCIKKQILALGIDGWMADFGEYLPTDVKLFNGVSPMLEHNHWPALWARCNYEAVAESGKLGEAVFFMRSGATGSQKYCPLLWAGDQSVDFSRHDGLGTTITAALSAGMCGCGLSHSDIGGYTSLFGNRRTKELFLRWAEMAVFTPVMRTHEGNRPDENFQIYDDEDALKQFARLAKIHVALKPYLKQLVEENATRGLPVQRPLFVHYPEDRAAYQIQTEYLFGRELLVAPVLEKEACKWRVYLPQDSWVHLWSGAEFGGGEHLVDAPIGYPPVFYRKESEYKRLFRGLADL
ncbi:glycosyl hydrolase, family 31 [Clostridium sp. MSTE9]|uniref:alpha-glucosidase n=1 Tax=Clostridium sp. (strain MSTE9) TaxID=1105031 RepID=UPI00026F2A0E|nr:alpha-glucosidase [Clostridium sp. MSTE9]EJF39095.1 glycosyl hydrolase, family 31 [Clostridium sp. MSTE9]